MLISLLAFSLSEICLAATPVPPPIPEKMGEVVLSEATRKAVEASFTHARDNKGEAESHGQEATPAPPSIPSAVPEANFSPETQSKVDDAFSRLAFQKPGAMDTMADDSEPKAKQAEEKAAQTFAEGSSSGKEIVQLEPVAQQQAESAPNPEAISVLAGAQLPPNLIVEDAIALQKELSAQAGY